MNECLNGLTCSRLGCLGRWILVILGAHLAHLVEKLLLVVEVDFRVLKLWRLVCVGTARHGHDHVRALRQLGLAHGASASQIQLATSHLDIRKLRHA